MTDPSPPPKGAKPKKPRTISSRDERYVALGMAAAGMPQRKIAAALLTDQAEVSRKLSRIPDANEQIAIYRDNMRVTKMGRLFDTEKKLWERIDAEIPKGSAKDVDALYRAAHASEKMAASIAGEAQKVEVKSEATSNVDLKALLVTLGLDGLKDLG